jgi:hypothetical protein
LKEKRKKEIQEGLACLEALEELGPLDDISCKRKVEWKVELLQILEDEELYWFKRSHKNWLLKEDNNTKNFHRMANMKRRK